MKEKTFSRPPSSPSLNPWPNSRSHRIMRGPVSRAGERPFVPEYSQQSHDPGTSFLWPGWLGALHQPQEEPSLGPMQAALPLCPGVQPPSPPGPPSPVGRPPQKGQLPQPLAWGTWQGSFQLHHASPPAANSLILWGFCSGATAWLHPGVSGNPSQPGSSQGTCSNASLSTRCWIKQL